MDPAITERLVDTFHNFERMRFAPIAAQALAPAFLLSACAAVLSVLMNRLWRILDQFRALDSDRATPESRQDAARLLVRARLIYHAIRSTIGSALAIAAVVLVVFLDTLFGMTHEWGSALLFLLAFGLFSHAFVCLWREVRIAMLKFGELMISGDANSRAPD
jgi:Protein of unknown function (DUF2721)